MRKLFFAICFIVSAAGLSQAFAASRPLRDQIDLQQTQKAPALPPLRMEDDANIPKDSEAFYNYIRERALNVPTMTMEELEQTSSMNTQWSSEYIASQAKPKSTFEQIYEHAVDRLNNVTQNQPQDIIYYTPQTSNSQERREWGRLDFPVINVAMPNGENVLAPAKEHIPYLLSRIEILPNGMVHIKETVNVIANGQKLQHGLSKALPKYSTSRTGIRNRTIPYLNGVKINGMEIDYQIKDAYDRYLITPKQQFDLKPGIYTFEFDYMLDRKLWYYDKFNEFYWDVTGSFWNLVVARAVATVRLPVNVSPLGQTMMVGFPPNNLTDQNTRITQDPKTNALGFASQIPLFAGEGMHLIISIPKSGFLNPDFNKKFEWFIEDYGDIIFSLGAFMAILVAYLISWKYIEINANKEKAKIVRTPALLRMLRRGVYDKASFASFLLELYAKNIIDIDNENGSVLLIKKTDNLTRLGSNEQKAVQALFGKQETVLRANALNSMRFQRACQIIEKDTKRRFRMLSVKLVSGYIALSGGMLLLAEIAIAYLNLNSGEIFATLLSSTLTAVFYIWVLQKNFAKRWVAYTAKGLAAMMLALLVFAMSFFIHVVSGMLIVASVAVIFFYSRLFMRRNGLIKNNIEETKKYAHYLEDNAQQIILGQEFKKQQPYIYALDAVKEYPDTTEGYKINLMPPIQSLL